MPQKPAQTKPRLAILVLGMHRSGTSATAGLISKLGVGLPDNLQPAQAENERGFFELTVIGQAHDKLLAANGASWNSLDDLTGIGKTPAGRAFVAAMRTYLEAQFERSALLVLKDPRMCRMLDIWLPLIEGLNADLLTVHVVRNPLAVAASLRDRNGFSPGRSLLIWLDHVLRAERETRGLARLFVNYDELLGDWRKFAERVHKSGLIPTPMDFSSRIEIESFLSETIRHHKYPVSDVMTDEGLPAWIKEPFGALEAAARSEGEPEPACLDRAFGDFTRARKLFGGAIADHQRAIARLEAKLSDAGIVNDRLAEELQGTAAREAALASAHDTLEAMVAGLRQELTQTAAREANTVGGLRRELAQTAAREANLARQLSASEDKAKGLSQELAQRQERLATQARASEEALQAAKRESERHSEQALRQRQRADGMAGYNQHLERTVRALEETIAEIRGSTSWRMTAPLRRAVTGLRRARTPRKASLASNADSDQDGRAAADRAPAARAAPAQRAWPDHLAGKEPPPIDIIIPIYRGLATTKACVESVLGSRPGIPHEIILIDDFSPEPEVRDYVAGLAGRPGITVLRNASNQGFVRTVNLGMALHPDRDVVLLNSDTEVANDWLRRLALAAYSGPKISSVTPFSNNATICSYPRFCEENHLPEGLSLGALDALFAEANAAQSVEIPTAVGFCMFIRRDCLNEIGAFDAEAFGKGYGEENDFCLRASARGWTHLLAADTFVFHKGGVSFKESAIALQAKAAEIIRARWPDYFNDIAKHVAQDLEKPFRIAATALRYQRDTRQKILIVTQAYGGGVERHIEDLKVLSAQDALFLTLRPAGNALVRLESSAADGVSQEFDLDREAQQLAALLAAFGVSRLHIHHTLHFSEGLKALVERLGLPFDFTIHDYFSICPRIHLGATDGAYCGEPDAAGCNICIRRDVPAYDRTIAEYRASRAWLVTDAARVIAPSHDTARRFQRYFPEAKIHVVPHASDRIGTQPPYPPPLRSDERLRVLVLGVLAPHKGLGKIMDLVEAADKADASLEVHLLGMVQGAAPPSARFIDHGSYEDADLTDLIARVNPHVIWFPAQVPETYSYTLDAALATGRPIASSDLGALPERLAARDWAWVGPWAESGAWYLAALLKAREEIAQGQSPAPTLAPLPPLIQEGFYQLHYLGSVRAKPDQRRRLLAVDSPLMPTACGQVRVALPLTHPALIDDIELAVLPLEEIMHADAHAILVQRNAVTSADGANRLADHCERRGIRKLFEIDDDLFALPDSHPEKRVYEKELLGAQAFLKRADAIIVSTEVLAERMRAFNPAVHVMANSLDDRLWFSGHRGQPRPRKPGEALRLAFVGSGTHAADLELIAPAMRAVLKRRPDAIEFYMVGARFAAQHALPALDLRVPPHLAGNYVRFVDWVRRSADWHVGLAPLLPSAFNAAKSPLKFLDYGALGLAGIYPNDAPFSTVVEHGKTGLLAQTPADWADALIRLIDDEPLRLEMAHAARSEIRARHTLRANGAALRSAWLALMG